MRRRLQTHWNDRPINLRTLDNPLPHKHMYVELWRIILSKKGDGMWYRFRHLSDLPVKKIQQINRGIFRHYWLAGYSVKYLVTITTEIDGLCFHWPLRDPAEIDRETSVISRERKDRRNAQRRRQSVIERLAKKYAVEED